MRCADQHASARLNPAPKAGPLIEATTGLVIWRIAVTTRPADPRRRENINASLTFIMFRHRCDIPAGTERSPSSGDYDKQGVSFAAGGFERFARSRRMCPARAFNFPDD